MYCPKCGTENFSEAVFCKRCGENIKKSSTIGSQSSVFFPGYFPVGEAIPLVERRSLKKGNNKKIIWIFVSVILLIGLILGGLYFFFIGRYKDNYYMSRKTVCQADGSDGKYVTQLWEYNKNGDVTKMSSDDETVIYQYDSKGKLLIISLTDDTGTEKIKFDYSKSDGNDIGFGKDSDGNTIKLEYNRKNKLISKRIFNDKREEVYSETREYYIDGTLSKIIAEDKNFLIKRKNITEYDRAGNISKEERYDISTDGEETLFYSVEYKHGTTVKQYHVLPDGYSVTEYSENGEEKMTVYDEDDNVVDCSRSIIEEKTEEYIKFAYYDENNNAEGYRIVYYGKEQKASKIENYDADGNLEGYSEQEHDKQGHILFFKNYDKNGKMIYSEEEVWSKK